MNDVPSLRLPPKEELAASLRAKGLTKAATARAVGTSISTMGRWNERPDFLARVEALRVSVDLQASEILQESLTAAARVTSDIIAGRELDVQMICPSCGDAVTVAAFAEVRLRQKTSQWLLDTYYKGKLPSPSTKDKEEEAEEALDSQTRDAMLQRGQGEAAEDDYEAENELEEE